MPYKSNSELPDNVQHVLPKHGQDIYRETFNHAFDEYKDAKKLDGDDTQEEVAHKVAWSSVKQKYEKNDSNGKWRLKK